MWTTMTTPVGDLRIVAVDDAIRAIQFAPFPESPAMGERDDDHPLLVEALRQLHAYFDGTLTEFDLPLDPVGSVFQQEVWLALRQIPYGQTTSYGEIARRIGRTATASRAVGLANGRNPLSIVVPCHRVIGAKGALIGYAGGLERKQTLLALERGSLL